MCDRCCVRVVQGAAAPAVPGGQRGDRQSLLDKSSNVLYCLGDQGAVSTPLFVLLLLFLSLPLSIPRLLPASCLSQFQLPAGCRFRGGALPFDKRSISHRCVEGALPHTSHGLIGRYLGLFGLTGSYVVMVTAPHGFGRVVRSKKAGREWRCCGVAEVEPLCDAGYNFLSLMQQGANQGVCLGCSRPWGGAAGRLCQGEILKSSQWLRDGPL